jgi:hypothetical protein
MRRSRSLEKHFFPAVSPSNKGDMSGEIHARQKESRSDFDTHFSAPAYRFTELLKKNRSQNHNPQVF